MICHVKCRDENSILRRVMELEVKGRRPVGRPKKTWSKIMEEDMSKLNNTEDMAKYRKQWRELINYHVQPQEWEIRDSKINKDDDDDDDDDVCIKIAFNR